MIVRQRQPELLLQSGDVFGKAIGATVQPTVCFASDGDFQMNYQELATAMQARAQPIILLLNNGIYGTIRAHQERNYPARISGTTMENPDFVALARAYGFHAERVEQTEEFAAAFERACASERGCCSISIFLPKRLPRARRSAKSMLSVRANWVRR